jgi:hypothetical protein
LGTPRSGTTQTEQQDNNGTDSTGEHLARQLQQWYRQHELETLQTELAEVKTKLSPNYHRKLEILASIDELKQKMATDGAEQTHEVDALELETLQTALAEVKTKLQATAVGGRVKRVERVLGATMQSLPAGAQANMLQEVAGTCPLVAAPFQTVLAERPAFSLWLDTNAISHTEFATGAGVARPYVSYFIAGTYCPPAAEQKIRAHWKHMLCRNNRTLMVMPPPQDSESKMQMNVRKKKASQTSTPQQRSAGPVELWLKPKKGRQSRKRFEATIPPDGFGIVADQDGIWYGSLKLYCESLSVSADGHVLERSSNWRNPDTCPAR